MTKIAVFTIFLAGFLYVNAQPKFVITVHSSYLEPKHELAGDMLDSSDRENTLLMRSGLGIGLDGKYFFGSGRNIGVMFSVGYNMFSNTESYVEEYGEDIERSINDFNYGIGAEYSVFPGGRVNPFINAVFTGHMYSGKFNFTNTGYTLKYEMEPESRYGAAFGLGVNLALNNSIGFTIGGKYHLANLIGRNYDTTVLDPNTFRLNDERYIKIYGVTRYVYPAKSIAYLQIYLGVSFYFDRPKKISK